MKLIVATMKGLAAFYDDEGGQDMVEYSLLLAFVALAAVGLLLGIKNEIKGTYSTISNTLSSASTAAS